MTSVKSRGEDCKPEVIITGGKGFIGSHLTAALLSRGYNVSHLSRSSGYSGGVKGYEWLPEKGKIEKGALAGKDIIVHLAGANLGSNLWTDARKALIFNSRVQSARFLFSVVSEEGLQPEAFISASGIGYYGSITSDEIFNEESPPGNDFLAVTCREWEAAAALFAENGIRTAMIRTAPVLARKGGGLHKLIKPAGYGVIIRTGSGRQYMPWIHISDLCNIYLKVIEEKNSSGPYNAVSPHHISHDDFMKTLASVTGTSLFLPRIPGSILRTLMGEMSGIILNGSRVASDRIIGAGYRFLFPRLEDAISDITRKS